LLADLALSGVLRVAQFVIPDPAGGLVSAPGPVDAAFLQRVRPNQPHGLDVDEHASISAPRAVAAQIAALE
jgi:hypothetical protein